MSTRQSGNRRENRFGDLLREHGYVPFYSRGSRGVDLIAIHESDRSAPHLAVEVGGESKTIAASFDALYGARKPGGTVCLVARELKRRNRLFFRVHTDPDVFFDNDLDSVMRVVRTL